MSGYVERAFELFAHATCSIAVDVVQQLREFIRLKPIWHQEPCEGWMYVLVPSGIDRRTGVIQYSALAVYVRGETDRLTALRDWAFLDLKVRECEETRLWSRGVKLGEVKDVTLIQVAGRGYAKGGFKVRRHGKHYYHAAIVDKDPDRALIKALRLLRTWLEKRLRALLDALGLEDWSILPSLRSIMVKIRNIMDSLSERARQVVKIVSSFYEAVDNRLFTALKAVEVREKLGQLAKWAKQVLDAVILLPGIIASALKALATVADVEAGWARVLRRIDGLLTP